MIRSHFDELFMIGVVISLKCVVMTMIKLLIAAAFLVPQLLRFLIYLKKTKLHDALDLWCNSSLIATFFLCEKNLPEDSAQLQIRGLSCPSIFRFTRLNPMRISCRFSQLLSNFEADDVESDWLTWNKEVQLLPHDAIIADNRW